MVKPQPKHTEGEFEEGREVTRVDAEQSVVALIDKSQLDQAIATAHKWPRSMQKFRDKVLARATLNEETAAECFYTLERKDKNGKKKMIVGPSARWAEIVGGAWGNARAGARIVDDRGGFVVAQGVFMDLEENWSVTYEVQRRITTSSGYRYSEDMIGVTANAACAIAIRNAVLKGVPKALWADLWDQTRDVALGKGRTHETRRTRVFEKLAEQGIDEAKVLAKLEKPSLADVTPDDLMVIFGIMSKVKDGEKTIDEAFAIEDDDTGTNAPAVESVNKETGEIKNKAPAKAASGAPSDEDVAAAINKAKTQEAMDEAKALASSQPEPAKTRLLDLARARSIDLGLKSGDRV